jgi:hypothetical protein
MSRRTCWLLTGAVFLVGSGGLFGPAQPALADEKGEGMCVNPYYNYWAKSKKGATAVHLLKTKLGTPEGKLGADVSDEKRITYTLLEVNDKQVVLETVVTESDFFGEVQSAPTRLIYPKRVNKANLNRHLLDRGTENGEVSMTFQGKKMKCKTEAGTIKAAGGEEVEYKIWLSDEVPGRIVKKTRTTRQGGKVVAETTVTLESCKKAD